MSNSNIWEMYGLYSNPFTSEPLTLFSRDIPIDMFVGREKELSIVKKIISSHSSSRILLVGNIGIGKTTFANYVRYSKLEKGFFTPFAEIGVMSHWSPEDLMITTLSAIYNTLNRMVEKKAKMDKELMKRLETMFGICRSRDMGGSISVLGSGVGINYGGSVGSPIVNSYMLIELMKEVVEELKKAGFQKVIIQYNNLELIPEMGDKRLKILFNGIREFIETPDTHFIFIGDKTIPQFFSQIPRVEQVFQSPIILEPFTLEEIMAIIKKRIEVLTIKREGVEIKPLNPATSDAVSVLYDLYKGNVRDIMKSISTVVMEISKTQPIQINGHTIKRTLHGMAKERYLSQLNNTDLKILDIILRKGETTNKLISEKLKMQPQNVSNSLTNLKDALCIRLSRVEGRSRYYVPTPEASWLLLEPPPIEAGQRELGEFVSDYQQIPETKRL